MSAGSYRKPTAAPLNQKKYYEGKRPRGRPRLRWEDNIKMYLRGMGLETVEWIYLAQDRNSWRALLNTKKSSSSIKSGEFLD
jgi:hypothetical protein